jgi:hypothetical protein
VSKSGDVSQPGAFCSRARPPQRLHDFDPGLAEG